MAYDEFLADRVRLYFERKRIKFTEQRMMGGLCFMVKDKLCVGVDRNRLIARVGELKYEGCLKKKGCHVFDVTKRPLKGFVIVEAFAVDTDKSLQKWIDLCLEYNPLATSSRKK